MADITPNDEGLSAARGLGVAIILAAVLAAVYVGAAVVLF